VPKTQAFEQMMESLEMVVNQLEKGGQPLDKILELFEEGVKLSRQAQELLNKAEGKVEILTHKLNEVWQMENYEPDINVDDEEIEDDEDEDDTV
jgi:exodeoxyribonuclease VII small subunit